MPKTIQQNLAPADRAAQLAMAALLTPIREIFAFVEDTMVIKVGYAMAAHRLSELNILLHVSVVGGALSALLAFGLMVFAALYDPLAAPLLNPSAATNAALIGAGCPLLPTTAELLSHARIYWLLTAAAWLPAFVGKGVLGFFLGTRNFGAFAVPLVVNLTLPIALWFGLLPLAKSGVSALSPLSVLGIAYGTAEWINAAAFGVYFCAATSLRRKYGLRLLCRGGELFAAGGEARRVVRESVEQGLQLMVVDLCIQLSLTCTIYLAAAQNFETAYKLAAANAAYWEMGPSYLVGTMVALKMFGAQLIAAGRHAEFARLFLGGVFFVVVLASGAVFTAALKRQPLAYTYGESACVFASDAACAPAYARIFLPASSSRQQGDALSDVFAVFGPTVGLQMIFLLLRAGLATCHDFAFLAKASFGALVLVYLPAILVVHCAFRLTAAYYIAMYVPHFALLAVFGVRMAGHLRAMLAATDDAPAKGPWTQHTLRMTMSGSTSSGSSGPTMPTSTAAPMPPVALGGGLGAGGDSMRTPLIE